MKSDVSGSLRNDNNRGNPAELGKGDVLQQASEAPA